MLHFCTLFDTSYLDKGIALYKSLECVTTNYILYIFCFDDRSYEILNEFSLSHAVILHHSIFETETLLELKNKRSKAEYCWTCTPVIIEYVLNNYRVDSCTYLDADLYFYANPQILYDEFLSVNADAVIVEHRFKDNRYGRKLEKRNGKYCVQFNYFRQSKNAKKILEWWKNKCFEWCYDIPETDRMGDQKYLNKFTSLFNGVHEIQHLGAGVAPWNLEQYDLYSVNDSKIFLKSKDGSIFPLIFYHFQNIRYMPGRRVNIKSQSKKRTLKYIIYIPYLREIEEIRSMLMERYEISYKAKGIIRSSNVIVGLLQKNFAAFKFQSPSDIVNLNKLEKYMAKNEKINIRIH